MTLLKPLASSRASLPAQSPSLSAAQPSTMPLGKLDTSAAGESSSEAAENSSSAMIEKPPFPHRKMMKTEKPAS